MARNRRDETDNDNSSIFSGKGTTVMVDVCVEEDQKNRTNVEFGIFISYIHRGITDAFTVSVSGVFLDAYSWVT